MNTTGWVIVILLGVGAAYDLIAAQHHSDITISHELYEAATANPVVALFIGIVLGHVLWPQR